MSASGGVATTCAPIAAADPDHPTTWRRRLSPRTLLAARNPWWAEILLLLVSYLGYVASRVLTEGSRDAAMHHGRQIWLAEQLLGISPERWMNQALTGHHTLENVASFYYQTLHFTVTPLVLVWLFRFLPGLYPFFRSALVAGSAIAILGFWLYPTAPPRFAIPGFADTIAYETTLGGGESATTGDIGGLSLINVYAAMPSLHVGWAAWCALAVVFACRRWPLRYGAWLYPLATATVVFATANHYIADAIVGCGVMALGVLAAFWICRPAHTVHAVHTRARSPGALSLVGRSMEAVGRVTTPSVMCLPRLPPKVRRTDLHRRS